MKKQLKKWFKKLKETLKLMNKTITYIHDTSHILRIVIFFDLIWSRIFYGVSINEYRIFKFYTIKHSLRKTYLTKRKHDRFIKWNINKDILPVINDKNKFDSRFKEFINRDIHDVNDISFKDFEEYNYKNKELICRSKSSSFINSYKVYYLKDFRSPAFVSDKIKKDGLRLVEKNINCHKVLQGISNNLVFINVVTFCKKNNVTILASTIKFKDDNKVITGYVNHNKGVLNGNLKDEHDNVYSFFNNYELPFYDNIKKQAIKLALELSEIKEVEWSFTVNSRGTVLLMDANIWDDTIFVQQPEYLYNKVGLKPKFKKCNRD